MKKLIFIALFSIIISCKKEDAATNSTKDLLTAKTWKSTEFVVDGVIKTSWCWLNSLYDFTPSGVFFNTYGDNLGACFSMDPIGTIYKYSWKLSADNQWLITQRNAIPVTEFDSFQIISISNTFLKTKRVVFKSTPPVKIFEDTFTAQ